MTYNYTDISLTEFPGEISLILYSGSCTCQCPWCFNPDLINKKPLSFKQAKDAIEALRMSAVTMTATGASDISATASSLAATEGLDAIYIPTDNNIAGNTDAVKNAVRGKGIIVVCGEEGMTRGCGHVTLSISYTNLGRVTGEMAAKILNKEATAASLAVKTMTAEDCEYVMCSSNITDANVTIPQSVIDKCRDISE